MKILHLGPPHANILRFLENFGDSIVNIQEPLSDDSRLIQEANFIVSYGYRYIIKKDVLDVFPSRAINLHISYLPWNRGADPNLWSFLEDTPKGVTIHLIDEGIDTGAILAQREINFDPNDTLRTSYDRLSTSIEDLFIKTWPKIRNREITPQHQKGKGTFHRLKDKKQYEHLLTHGWDTPVKNLTCKALKGAMEEEVNE